MGESPKYLSDLLHYKINGQRADLEVPTSNSSYGKRAFSVVAPRIWNNLPREVKESRTTTMFKKKLKTYLFRLNTRDVGKIGTYYGS